MWKVIVAIMFITVAAAAYAVKPSDPTPSGRQLVGFTNAKFTGSNPTTGVLQFNQACVAEFPGSHMATTADVINTTSPVSLPGTGGFAWVQPIIVAAGDSLAWDVSGFVASVSAGITCLSRDSTSGLTVGEQGQFDAASCSSALAVACSQ